MPRIRQAGRGGAGGQGDLPEGLERDLKLEVERYEPGLYHFIPMGKAMLRSGETVSFFRPIDEQRLRGSLDALLKGWRQMVDLKIRKTGAPAKDFVFPFQDAWNLAKSPQHLQQFAHKLAHVGWKLFRLLFLIPSSKEELRYTKRRERFLRVLLKSLATGSRTITVISDDLMIPWRMLYTLPVPNLADVKDVKEISKRHTSQEGFWNGFWGYRHLIEHCPTQMPASPVIAPVARRKKLVAGLHFDQKLRLDVKKDLVARQREYFSLHEQLRRTERFYRRELVAALNSGDFDDQIMYFFCHGVDPQSTHLPPMDASSLQLTIDKGNADESRISAADFDAIVEDEGLDSRPFVFCNVCKGGRMTSYFYESIPKVLLRKGAVAMVGPQIDIPALFADELSRRFFRTFVRQGRSRPKTVSDTLRGLTRTFIIKNNNPLGLTYSIYRGVDVVVRW